MSILRMDIKPGESVRIGPYAVITLEEKAGKTARLKIDADRAVSISRVEPQTAAQIAARGITSKA